MDRVSVDWIDITLVGYQNLQGGWHMITYLFMIVEDAISPEWPSSNNMSVGQYVTFLRVDNEPGGLAGDCRVCVEGTCLAKMY